MGQERAEPRRRDAAATRAAILEAARAAFTRDSYERVGVRDVAALAGVDPALVVRYFGSKEGLFNAAVQGKFDVGELLTGDRAEWGERLARYMLRKGETEGAFDPLLAMLRSAANDQGTPLLRAWIDDEVIRPLAERIGGDHAELRVGLVTSFLIGLAIVRDIVRSAPLADADVETLVPLVAPLLQRYVDGTVP